MAGRKFPYLTAFVSCSGGCNAVHGLDGIPACSWGCVGCGACEEACKFDAIHVVGGLAAVDEEKCRACAACTKACSKGLIRMRQIGMPIQVSCANHDSGKKAMEVCKNACIGCGLCTKKCPANAIRMEDGLPVIDSERCLSCGMCVVNCPKQAIRDLRGIL